MIPTDRKRFELLADLISTPDEVCATAVEAYRTHHVGMRRADFEDVLAILKRESDLIVAQIRGVRGR